MSTRSHPFLVASFIALAFMPNFCDALECAQGSNGVVDPEEDPQFTVKECPADAKYVFCHKTICSSANKDFFLLGCTSDMPEDEMKWGFIAWVHKYQPDAVNLTCHVKIGYPNQSVPFPIPAEFDKSTPGPESTPMTDDATAKVLAPMAFVLPLIFAGNFHGTVWPKFVDE